MNAFLFPGQGSQEIGMAADLFKSDASFRGMVEQASQLVNADLERICLKGPERELIRTSYLQPLLVCVELGYFGKLIEKGIRPDVVLGHSLGEITALAAAGIVSFSDAVSMAAKRGMLMDSAIKSIKGGMLAVTAIDRERLLAWVKSMPCDRVVLANDNSPNQVILSGLEAALDEAVQFVRSEQLGTSRKLPVAGPWHSPFMIEAQGDFAKWVESILFSPSSIRMIFNVSGDCEESPGRMRELAVQNLSSQVRWRSCMSTLKAAKPDRLFEIGPGRVLAGLARANGFGEEISINTVNNLRGVELAARG